MKLDDLRQGVGTLWDSVTEGWERLRQGAAGALTRYRPEHKASLPAPDEVDDASYLPSASWAMLGGDVFEDDKRIVVRLEAPGMNKSDFDIQVLDGALVVRGEKRFERETTEGRWSVLQCAYGQLPADRAAAGGGEGRSSPRQLPQRRARGRAAEADTRPAERDEDRRRLKPVRAGGPGVAGHRHGPCSESLRHVDTLEKRFAGARQRRRPRLGAHRRDPVADGERLPDPFDLGLVDGCAGRRHYARAQAPGVCRLGVCAGTRARHSAARPGSAAAG